MTAKMLEELDDLDPMKYSVQEDAKPKTWKKPAPDTGRGLVNYWLDKMSAPLGQNRARKDLNIIHMAAAINRWKDKFGVTPDQVRKLVDFYAQNPEVWPSKDKTAWKDFIYNGPKVAVKNNLY
jgi:hypothetical protein